MSIASAIGHPGWLVEVAIFACGFAGVVTVVEKAVRFARRRRNR